MFKVAAPDPVQKQLRQHKKLWNKQVSTFISDLLEFKKTMNGAPSKIFPQKGTIKEPIPGDPVALLGKLTGAFQSITEGGHAIVEEQITYARTRRRPRPKGMAAPTTPAAPIPATPATPEAPKVDLTQQLTASQYADRLVKIASSFEEKYDLMSEASNPVSRFFTKLLNPTFGFSNAANVRRTRMQLLTACAKTYKKLNQLQVDIVRSSDESIDAAHKVFVDDVWKNWNTVRIGFKTFKGLLPQGVKDSGGPVPPSKEMEKEKEKEHSEAEKLEKKMDQIDQATQEGKPAPGDPGFEAPPGEEPIQSWMPAAEGLLQGTALKEQIRLARGQRKEYFDNLRRLSVFVKDPNVFSDMQIVSEKFDYNPEKLSPTLIVAYRQLIYNLNNMLGTSGRSLTEIYKTLEAQQNARIKDEQEKLKQQQKNLFSPPSAAPVPPKQASEQLEAISQAFLKKWVGKTRHQMSLFDKTSNTRLQIFEVAKEARKTIDQIMDHLEKDINAETMDPLIQKVNTQLEAIRGMIMNLYQLRTVEKKKQKVK